MIKLTMFKKDFVGGQWPFSVDSMEIEVCANKAIIIHHNNQKLQINGVPSNFERLEHDNPIWVDRFYATGIVAKASLFEVISRALSFCPAQ
jgi:hypothetical protein